MGECNLASIKCRNICVVNFLSQAVEFQLGFIGVALLYNINTVDL